MSFTSTILMVSFLPIVVLAYYTTKKDTLRKIILLVSSIVFYAWGEPLLIFVVVFLFMLNYCTTMLCVRLGNKYSSILLCFVVCIDVVVLLVFKYTNFILSNIGTVFDIPISQINIRLPLGISFIVFQLISFCVDCYRENCVYSLLDSAVFISFFPKITMGPLAKIGDFKLPSSERCDYYKVRNGIQRISIGLIKKVLIANKISGLANWAFSANNIDSLTMVGAIVGAIAYTIQIYFDFSGYTDMALGIANLFGIDLPENFNYPYISHSVTEFWRRWHITLGMWFRQYVYIPLGGNRVKTKLRHLLNLFIAWILTGLWHGASWTFIIWGLYYFILISFEKLTNLESKSKWAGYIYTIIFTVIGWTVFRSDSISHLSIYFTKMIGLNCCILDSLTLQMINTYKIYIIMGIVFSFPILETVRKWFNIFKINRTLKVIIVDTLTIILIIIGISYAANSSYTPFIYNNF